MMTSQTVTDPRPEKLVQLILADPTCCGVHALQIAKVCTCRFVFDHHGPIPPGWVTVWSSDLSRGPRGKSYGPPDQAIQKYKGSHPPHAHAVDG